MVWHRASTLHDRVTSRLGTGGGYRSVPSYIPFPCSREITAASTPSPSVLSTRSRAFVWVEAGSRHPFFFFKFGRFRRILCDWHFPRHRRSERGPALRETTRFVYCGTHPPLLVSLSSEKSGTALHRRIQNLTGNRDNAQRTQQIIDQHTTTAKQQRHYYSPHAYVRTTKILLVHHHTFRLFVLLTVCVVLCGASVPSSVKPCIIPRSRARVCGIPASSW